MNGVGASDIVGAAVGSAERVGVLVSVIVTTRSGSKVDARFPPQAVPGPRFAWVPITATTAPTAKKTMRRRILLSRGVGSGSFVSGMGAYPSRIATHAVEDEHLVDSRPWRET